MTQLAKTKLGSWAGSHMQVLDKIKIRSSRIFRFIFLHLNQTWHWFTHDIYKSCLNMHHQHAWETIHCWPRNTTRTPAMPSWLLCTEGKGINGIRRRGRCLADATPTTANGGNSVTAVASPPDLQREIPRKCHPAQNQLNLTFSFMRRIIVTWIKTSSVNFCEKIYELLLSSMWLRSSLFIARLYHIQRWKSERPLNGIGRV